MSIVVIWSAGETSSGHNDRVDVSRENASASGCVQIREYCGRDSAGHWIDIPIDDIEAVIEAMRCEAAGPLGKALIKAERAQANAQEQQ